MRKRPLRSHVFRSGRTASILVLALLAGCAGSGEESLVGEIAYSVDRSKPGASIVVVRDDGTGVRRVTAAQRRTNASRPVWSPDGTKIAFTRSAPEGLSFHVSVVNANGTGERRLGPGSGPQWTRGGTALLVERRDGIHLVNVDGSGKRLLVRGTAHALSRDGSKLAFLRYTVRPAYDGGCCITDTSALFTVSLEGGGLRRLASTSGGDEGYHFRDPAWLAGDREIAVLAENEYGGDASLKTVSEQRRQQVIVESVGDDFEWSPEGDRLAYSDDFDPILYVARGDGSEPRAFSQAAVTPDRPRGLRWSPDGEKIAFYAAANADPENLQDIYAIDADDGDRRRIGRVRGYGVDLAWRPLTD
jgi:Tol biopolymer transport system component